MKRIILFISCFVIAVSSYAITDVKKPEIKIGKKMSEEKIEQSFKPKCFEVDFFFDMWVCMVW